MLRISNRVSFKDPVGRVYSTDQMILSLRNNAKIYTVADNQRYLFVHLSGDDHPPESQIRVMAEWSSDLTAKSNVLWPEMECYRLDDDAFCGFLAQRINIPDDIISLRQFLALDDPCHGDLSLILTIGLNLAKCIFALHHCAKNYVIGDLHPRDFYVSSGGQVFSFNAYRSSLDTQLITDRRYLAPEYIAAQSRLTKSSDSFSFALILFELLTGIFPFGTHEPDTVFDNEQIEDMLINGESIYYFNHSQQCMAVESRLQNISPDLAEMFRLTFDYCGCNRYDEMRPSIEDWINVLERQTVNTK